MQSNVETYIKINNALEPVIKKLENGYCEYIGNLSDALVAHRLSCKESSVATIRKRMFGKLRDNPMAQAHGAISELRLEIKGLKNAYDNLEREFEALKRWALGRGYTIPNGRMHHG